MIMPLEYRYGGPGARLLRLKEGSGPSVLAELLARSPVMPVVTIADAADAAPLARALARGGLAAIEVTLRTPAAFEAIARIAGEVEGLAVGAGTVLSPRDCDAAAKAGAAFAVSPGFTTHLAADACLPLLPGVATASEAMAALDAGFDLLKFFPAEAAGGAAMLRALGGPLPQLRFCPTGGISLDNAPAYLALANVICVGGSWLSPTALLASGDWAEIEMLARRAASLSPRGDDVNAAVRS